MANLPTIGQYMDRYIYTIPPDMPVFDAVQVLVEHRVTGAPVVDKKNKVLGILTEGDCLRVLATGDGGGKRPEEYVVSEIMSEAQTVPSDMDIYYAAGLLLRTGYRRLLVVDQNEALCGAITRFDILKALRRRLSESE